MPEDPKKVIEDYIAFLQHVKTLVAPLSISQKNQLAEILRSQLVLLVALKKSSHLGDHSVSFL